MAMYKFVKGSRLFMQGTRESSDYDNVADTFHPSSFADSTPGRNGNHVVHHRVQVPIPPKVTNLCLQTFVIMYKSW
jgi:hypothetical protein